MRSSGDLESNGLEQIYKNIEFVGISSKAAEEFVLRNKRPELLPTSILGRYPPLETISDWVSNLNYFGSVGLSLSSNLGKATN